MSKRFSKIYVEITNYCNLNCSFCSIDNLEKKEMSVDEFRIVIDKIKDYTDSIYLHVKGEPLLHSHLDEILDVCDKNKINVCITTNGTLLFKTKDILLKQHIKQIKQVFTSCDELSQKSTIIYRIWTLSSLKLDKLSTNIVNKVCEHYKLSTEIVDKIKEDKNIKIRNNIYIDKDYEFSWPEISNKNSEHGTCLGTRSHIAILVSGNITPCCLDSKGIIKLGNIFQNDLEDILNSELFKEINNGFKNNKAVHKLCQSCSYKNRFSKDM